MATCNTNCACTETCDDGTCPNTFCNDAFVDLPKIARMRLVGADDRCLQEFPPGSKGFVVFDGKGGAIVSIDPTYDLKELVTYLRDGNGDVVFEGDVPVRVTPEVDYLVTEDENGKLKKFRGPQTGTGFLYWDGSKYVFGSMREEGLCTTAPIPTSNEVKLAGWTTDACDPCGDETKCVYRWVPLAEGIVQVDSEGNASTLDLCATEEEDLIDQSAAASLLGCNGDGELAGVRPFSLAEPGECSVLVNKGEVDSEWEAAPLDTPAPMGFVMPVTNAISVYKISKDYTVAPENLLASLNGQVASDLPRTGETITLSPPDGAVGVILKTYAFIHLFNTSNGAVFWVKSNGVPLAVASAIEMEAGNQVASDSTVAETTLPLTGDSISVDLDFNKSGGSDSAHAYRVEIWVTGWIINPCAALSS